jgi:hypothetical protein
MKRDAGIILGLGGASIALHALPFVLYGLNPLGYDTGFYRRYLIQPFLSFPNAPVPGLGSDALIPRILLDILRLAHLPPDLILNGSYILLWAIMPGLLYLFLRKYLGTRGAIIAGALLIGSAVAYNGYWYMLYKNAFALDLILLAFIALEERWLYAALALDVLIALSHRTSAIIYLLTLGTLFLAWRGRRKEMLLHGVVAGLAFLLVNLPAVHQAQVALPTAIFLEWPDYLRLSAPLIIALVLGARGLWSKRIPPPLLAFAGASFLFPTFGLPFYERIFLFCDVALCALAAYGVEWLMLQIDFSALDRRAYLALGALCVIGGLFVGNFWSQVRDLRPLMTSQDTAAIAAVGALVPHDATILTTSNEAPWYEGWTLSHIAAPGLLHDTHNLDKWEAFWNSTSTPERIAFLNSFSQPLYVSTLGDISDLIGVPPACLALIAPDLYRSNCAASN